ncbi:tetratricopeptide repeat protein [Spirosoma soli]|uniref:Tetratricopeptide repeat protein n=1 Tax=Spirosoma soli TaxID=1770529 RepID=A0ABW5M008_9BACT
MIYLFIVAWLWWNEPLPMNQISQNNEARRQAEAAYRAGYYVQALTLYTYLSRVTTTIDPAVRLNLGHTYFQLKRYAKARPQYETLLRSDRPDLRTVAATQLGVMACLEGDSATALSLFEQALLENADNEPARYNFELVKKYYSGKMPSTNPHQKPSKRKPQMVNKPQPSGGQQVERSARQDELLRRFQRMDLNEEQALQLLDAMQNDDLPYALTRSARQSTKPAPSGNRW